MSEPLAGAYECVGIARLTHTYGGMVVVLVPDHEAHHPLLVLGTDLDTLPPHFAEGKRFTITIAPETVP